MKVAIVLPTVSYIIGGAEKIVLKHVLYLSKKGHDVVLLTTKQAIEDQTFIYKELKRKINKHIKIIEKSIEVKGQDFYKQDRERNREYWDIEALLFSNAIYESFVYEKPDIIVSYYLPQGLIRPKQTKNVLYLLGSSSEHFELQKTFFLLYDATISISDSVKDRWLDCLNINVPNYILHTGVDLPKPTPKKILTNNKQNIVFAGRLIKRKGVANLIMVVKELVKYFKNLHLWVLGDGPERAYLEGLVTKHKLNRYITFTGFVENVQDYYTGAELAVFPSLEKEGLMGVVLEAMSASLPVITTTGMGNEEIIRKGINGLLVRPNNNKELYDSISYLLSNHSVCKKMGEEAYKTIKNDFGWTRSINELEKILLDLIKNEPK